MEKQELEQAVALLERIVGVETVNPPGSEKPLAELVASYLEHTTAHVELCDLGGGRANVLARIAGSDMCKPLVLCGHLDTVPYGNREQWRFPPDRLTREGSRMYGRGTSDMKSGFAAMLYAFRKFCDCQAVPKSDILLIGTADEESMGEGAKAVLERVNLRDAAAVVIGEPTANHIALASKGVIWIEFVISGKTSHAAYPAEGVNAIELAYILAEQVKRCCDGYTHTYLTPPTCTLTGITGGVKINVVPDVCTAQVDIRTVPSLDHAALFEQINRLIVSLCAQHEGLSVTYSVSNNRPAVETVQDNEIVQRLSKIRAQVCGRPPAYIGTGYFSDASVFVTGGYVPSLLFGPGLPQNAHVPNEYVELEDYEQSIECYMALIKSYFTTG